MWSSVIGLTYKFNILWGADQNISSHNDKLKILFACGYKYYKKPEVHIAKNVIEKTIYIFLWLD